jgi:hypothetical protein
VANLEKPYSKYNKDIQALVSVTYQKGESGFKVFFANYKVLPYNKYLAYVSILEKYKLKKKMINTRSTYGKKEMWISNSRECIEDVAKDLHNQGTNVLLRGKMFEEDSDLISTSIENNSLAKDNISDKPPLVQDKLAKQCSIFRDSLNNKKASMDQIINLGKYYPKHGYQNPMFDAFSQSILNIKPPDVTEDHILFTEQLRNIILDTEEFVICVIPKHTIGTEPSGIRTIAKRLCNTPIIDGTNVIFRNREIDKKSFGGSRDINLEIDSLSVKNDSIVKDQQILLLDDVTTRGTSLKAGKYILEKAGAELVAMYALGLTQYL